MCELKSSALSYVTRVGIQKDLSKNYIDSTKRVLRYCFLAHAHHSSAPSFIEIRDEHYLDSCQEGGSSQVPSQTGSRSALKDYVEQELEMSPPDVEINITSRQPMGSQIFGLQREERISSSSLASSNAYPSCS